MSSRLTSRLVVPVNSTHSTAAAAFNLFSNEHTVASPHPSCPVPAISLSTSRLLTEQHPLVAIHAVRYLLSDGMEDAAKAAESMAVQQVLEAREALTFMLREQPLSLIVEAFWDILLVKPHRVPYFAVLVSLLNKASVELSEAIALDCGSRLAAALDPAAAARSAAAPGCALSPGSTVKAILRFQCALAALGVLSSASVRAQLGALVDAAVTLVTPSGDAPAHIRASQSYADFLVEAVLLALPWGGASIWENDADSVDSLFSRVASYIDARPFQVSPELSPWLAATPRTAASGAAFLPHLLQSLRDLHAAGWASICIPQPQELVDNAFNEGAVFDAALAAPAAPSLPCDLWNAGFHPRSGIWAILNPDLPRAPEKVLEADSLIAQEYYLHVLEAYAANGKACVDELTTGVPVPFPSVNLLVELLMSQMIMPAPPLLVFSYQSLMVRLVESVGQPLARAFGGCMKSLFESSEEMDILMLHRVSDLLAWFLSNNSFIWPWGRWARVLEKSPLDAERRFCSLTLAKLIRLCANLAYIQQHTLPEDDPRWSELVPASDQPAPLPHSAEADGTFQQPYEDIIQWLKDKIGDDEMYEKLEASCGDSAAAPFRCFVHALLFRAKTSPYHTETLLARYRSTIRKFIAKVNDNEADKSSAEQILLSTSEMVWQCSSQRASLTIARLVSEGFIRIPDVMQWAFSDPVTNSIDAGIPRIVAAHEPTATMALETVLSLFVTVIDQAEACNTKEQELKASIPKLQSELDKAVQDMAAAQQQSEDNSITDREREQLLDRIQTLTSAETQAREKLESSEKAHAEAAQKVEEYTKTFKEALDVCVTHFVSCITRLLAVKGEDSEMNGEGANASPGGENAHGKLMLNCMASFIRQVSVMARGTEDISASFARAQSERDSGLHEEIRKMLEVALPGLV